MLKYRPNISTMNALIRITCGLAALSWLVPKMVRRPWKGSYMIPVILSAMKVAEGIVRYCPMTALYNKGMDMYDDYTDEMMHDTSLHFKEDYSSNDDSSYNPS